MRAETVEIQIAAVQLKVQDGRSLQESMDVVREAVSDLRDADLVVLPEVWTPGYFAFHEYSAAAHHFTELQTFMAGLARDAGLILHGGSIIEEEDGRLFNTSLLFDANGSVLGRYRKMHLFGYESEEKKLLSRGDDVVVVDTPVGSIGMAVCYDLRFPEQFADMTALGAELISIPAAWPAARGAAWSTLLRARAMETQSFVAAANGAGSGTGGVELYGHSAVIHPSGHRLTSADGKPTVVVQSIDVSDVARERRSFPVSFDRRVMPRHGTLLFEREGESPLHFKPRRTILAAYTAREPEVVEDYIRELEAEGVPPPDEVPVLYPMGSGLVTTEASIDIVGPETCGEVEYALLIDDDDVYVAVASDHTDRAFERTSVHMSKQMCPKPVSGRVWRYSQLRDHWDSLVLTSTTPIDGQVYQQASVSSVIHPDELMELVAARLPGSLEGTIVFSGSVGHVENKGFRFENSFVASLEDPIRDDRLSLSYSVRDVTQGTSM